MLPFFLQETKTVEVEGLIFNAYDSLLVKEQVKVDNATTTSPRELMLRLAGMISSKEGIPIEKAIEVINSQNAESQEIKGKYTVEISAFYEKLTELILMQQVAGVTAIMSRAYEPMSKQLEEMKAAGGPLSHIKKYEDFVTKLKDWTEEDTKQLPLTVLQNVWAFFQREQNGGREPEIQTADAETEATETDEKKESTGQKSIGESKDIGQTIPDLAA